MKVVLAVSLGFVAVVSATNLTYSYQSNTDLHPVAFVVTQKPSKSYQSGLYFTCPYSGAVSQPGPAIYDSHGNFVWGSKEIGYCMDFRTQLLNGTEVLTLWQGTGSPANGYGDGRAIILNSTYNVIYNFTTNLPSGTDIHEFQIPTVNTPKVPAGSSALVTSYLTTHGNLSAVGGTGNDWFAECYLEEIDIKTSKVLFQWNASSHVNFADSYQIYPGASSSSNPWDFFHINSITKDSNGDYLISSRHYHQLIKINGTSGDIEWTLGGKHSSWTIGEGAEFSWQHDPRWLVEGELLSLFDNASNGPDREEPTSSGKILALNATSKIVTLKQQFLPPTSGLISGSQGSTTVLPDGNVLIGWGANPWLSEYTANGTQIYAAILGSPNVTTNIMNYRTFKSTTFKGHPQTLPDVAISNQTVYASWNGATEVSKWKVFTGHKATKLKATAHATRTGFETNITLHSVPAFVQVRAYDAHGKLLGASSVRAANGSTVVVGTLAPKPRGGLKPAMVGF